MLSLIVLTVTFIIVIVLLSLIFKDIGKKVFLSSAFVFISVVLFFISFVVGGWDGLWEGSFNGDGGSK